MYSHFQTEKSCWQFFQWLTSYNLRWPRPSTKGHMILLLNVIHQHPQNKSIHSHFLELLGWLGFQCLTTGTQPCSWFLCKMGYIHITVWELSVVCSLVKHQQTHTCTKWDNSYHLAMQRFLLVSKAKGMLLHIFRRQSHLHMTFTCKYFITKRLIYLAMSILKP